MNMGVYFFKFCLKSLNRLEKKIRKPQRVNFLTHTVYTVITEKYSHCSMYMFYLTALFFC